MENKLIVSLSPHVHGGDSVQKNMYGVLIALIPAFLVSLYFFGLGALIVTATSVAACLFFEWAIVKFLMKKPATTICDGSAVTVRNWCRQDVFRWSGLQPIQPGIGGTCIPVAFFPGADDNMAGSRSADILYGRYHRCYSAGIDETGYSRRCKCFEPDT